MNKKLPAIALALLLCTACTQTDFSDQQFEVPGQQEPAVREPVASSSEEQIQSTLRLAYQEEDALNPYQMTSTINFELIPLLYDSLVRPDPQGRPELLIASSIDAKENGFRVSLGADILFSDGTNVTGADVIYSAGLARTAGSAWAPLLSNVYEVSLDEAGDILFRLGRMDMDFPLLLSFPIIKEGSAAVKYPTGVSRYLVAGTTQNGLRLEQNPLYHRSPTRFNEIQLVNIEKSSALSFGLKTGDVDLVYSDLSSPELSNLSGSNVTVPLNNLLFIGINGKGDLLSQPEFRHALSLSINRDQLVARAYMGRADAALYPFHPNFYRLEDAERSTASDLTRAEELLDGLGLVQKDENGWRLFQGKPVELSLLVNSENSMRNAVATLVMEQLAEVGIKVSVVSKAFSEYQDQLLYSGYDMYVGEVRLMANMDFSALLGGASLGYAAAYSPELSERLEVYRSQGEQIRELCQMFTAQSPFIPLLFRQGLISMGDSFSGAPLATEQDLFYNIADW